MTREQFAHLVEFGESETLEFEPRQVVVAELYRAICAMLNRRGAGALRWCPGNAKMAGIDAKMTPDRQIESFPGAE